MKRLLFSLLLTPIFLLVLVAPAFAQTIERKEAVEVKKGQIVNGDFIATGESINIAGDIKGDAYLLGGNIFVEGVIDGDLIAAGGQIIVRGNIIQDARLAAGQVNIDGNIDGSLTALTGNLQIASNATVGKSIVAGAGTAILSGPIGQGATIGAGDLRVENSVGSNVVAGVSQLVLAPQAKIAGDLTYWSDKQVKIEEGAVVEGKTTQNIPQKAQAKEKQEAQRFFQGFKFAFTIFSFISALIIGLLFIKLAPVHAQRVSTIVSKNPLQAFLIGFAALILIPITSIIIMITIVGIPIGILFLFLYFLGIFLAKIAVALAVGSKILESQKQKPNLFLALLLGLAIWAAISVVPIIGAITGFFVVTVGLGAIMINKYNTYHELRAKKLI